MPGSLALATFLLDSRRGGNEYDQSHLPPGQQYEAVGHAVRATYFYSGMADIAVETQDHAYQSAVISLWDNMVNRILHDRRDRKQRDIRGLRIELLVAQRSILIADLYFSSTN